MIDLETIRSIPNGHRSTEVGIVPTEWQIRSLGSIVKRSRLGGNYPNQDEETGSPLIKMGNIGRGSIDTNKVEYIPDRIHPDDADRLGRGDILFNTRNTLDLVGKVAIWNNELPVAYYNSNLLRIEFDRDLISSNRYANYFLNSRGCISRLRGLATGTTSVAAIYARDLWRLPFLVPPLAEQRAIAAALSDADALIRSLSSLIAKMRSVKQAALQHLLTRKTRLPGFSGGWEDVNLGEGVSLLSGHHVLAARCNGSGRGVPYLTGPADFVNGAIHCTKFTEWPTAMCQALDILVTVKGSGAGSMMVSDGDYCISRQLMAIRVERWNPVFVYNMLIGTANKIKAAASGLIPGLSRSDILKQRVSVAPLPEQEAIAEVLLDMDSAIAQLEARQQKTRMLQQGMMQELLTGRVRLV